MKEQILQSGEYGGSKLEIVSIPKLGGAQTPSQAMALDFIEKSGATVKYIRATLNGGSVMTEAGALYYTKGNINNDFKTGGPGKMIGKMIKGALTNEAAFNPTYSGNGIVVLEPSFSHYMLVELENDSIIVDKGMYYASIGDIKTSAAIQQSISSAALGGEGLFQTKISGTGWVALELPAPMDEIEVFNIQNETVQVDGNFAILRTADIDFTVEKSAKSLIASSVGGEGFLCTFRGSGMVWLAPTAPIYKTMAFGGMQAVKGGNRNNIQ